MELWQCLALSVKAPSNRASFSFSGTRYEDGSCRRFPQNWPRPMASRRSNSGMRSTRDFPIARYGRNTDLAAIMANKWPGDYHNIKARLPAWNLFFNIAGYKTITLITTIVIGCKDTLIKKNHIIVFKPTFFIKIINS